MPNDLKIQSSPLTPTLPAGLRSGIRIRWGGPDFDRVMGVVVTLGAAERETAKAILERQLAPCGRQIAAVNLAKVDAVMAGRSKDGMNLSARAAVMTDELRQYPADLVERACKEWLATQKWLPAPAELIGLMEPELSKRRAMLKALERPADEAAPKPVERADPSRIDEILRKHGYTPAKPSREHTA